MIIIAATNSWTSRTGTHTSPWPASMRCVTVRAAQRVQSQFVRQSCALTRTLE
jgi:hypothetical protein